MKKLILITILTMFGFSAQADGNHTVGDYTEYLICYGQVTEVHKRTGLHSSNRAASIHIKEHVCSSWSRGESSGYPR